MENKTLNYNGQQYSLRISSYCNNDRIAIALYELYDGHYEPAFAATKNLDDFLFSPNEAFMDENNYPGITQCFIDAGLAKLINRMGHAEMCDYPVVELITDEIALYDHAPDLDDVDESDEDDYDDYDDVEWEDAADDEDVDALLRDLFGVEEDDDNE